MFRKGHTGMIKVKRATEDTPGTLEIKVRINGNAASTGNVKDLKQLSGLPLSNNAGHHSLHMLMFTIKSCDVVQPQLCHTDLAHVLNMGNFVLQCLGVCAVKSLM